MNRSIWGRFSCALLLIVGMLAMLTPARAQLLVKAGTTTRRVYAVLYATGTNTPTAGLTASATILKNGANAYVAGGGSVADVGNGTYCYTLAGSDTTGVTGSLLVRFAATGADPAIKEIQVVAFDPDDGAAFGLSRLDAAVSSRSTYAGADTAGTTTLLTRLPQALSFTGGNVNSAAQNLPSVYPLATNDETALAALFNMITGSGVNAKFTAGALSNAPTGSGGGDPWATLTSAENTAGSFGALIKAALTGHVPQTGDTFLRLGPPSGASIGADIANIPTALNAATVDTGLTLHQSQVLQLALLFDADRTWSASSHTAVLTWYRRGANASTPDKTKPVMVKTTVYASDNVQIVSQTVSVNTGNLSN